MAAWPWLWLWLATTLLAGLGGAPLAPLPAARPAPDWARAPHRPAGAWPVALGAASGLGQTPPQGRPPVAAHPGVLRAASRGTEAVAPPPASSVDDLLCIFDNLQGHPWTTAEEWRWLRAEAAQTHAALGAALPGLAGSDLSRLLAGLARMQQQSALPHLFPSGGTEIAVTACQHCCNPALVDALTAQQAAGLLWALVRLGWARGEALGCLLGRLGHHVAVGAAHGPHISLAVWAVGQAEERPPADLVVRFLARVVEAGAAARFGGQSVANTAWGLAKMGLCHTQLMTQLADRAVAGEVLGAMRAQELANTAWAYATLGVPHGPLMDALAARFAALEVVGQGTGQAVANMLWATARHGRPHEALLTAIARRFEDVSFVEALAPQAVANVAWACARLRWLPAAVRQALLHRGSQPGCLAALSPVAIMVFAWALATLQVVDRPLLAALGQRASHPRCLLAYRGHEVTILLWAYARLGVRCLPLLSAVRGLLLQHPSLLPNERADYVAILWWAFATLRFLDEVLLEGLAAHTLRPAFLRRLSPDNVAVILWSCGRVQCLHDALVDALAAHALHTDPLLRQYSPRNLANVAWAVARLQPPQPALLAAVARRVVHDGLLETAQPREVVALLYAFARRPREDAALRAAVAAALGRREALQWFSSLEACTVLAALPALVPGNRSIAEGVAERVRAGDGLHRCPPALLGAAVQALAALRVCDGPLLDMAAQRLADGVAGDADCATLAAALPAIAALGHRPPALAALAERLRVGGRLLEFCASSAAAADVALALYELGEPALVNDILAATGRRAPLPTTPRADSSADPDGGGAPDAPGHSLRLALLAAVAELGQIARQQPPTSAWDNTSVLQGSFLHQR